MFCPKCKLYSDKYFTEKLGVIASYFTLDVNYPQKSILQTILEGIASYFSYCP